MNHVCTSSFEARFDSTFGIRAGLDVGRLWRDYYFIYRPQYGYYTRHYYSATSPATTAIPAAISTTAAPASKPTIRFSAATLKVGDTLTINGNGYPANTKLQIMLGEGSANPIGPYATPVTDEQGNFSAKVTLDTTQEGAAFASGKVLVVVTTQNGAVGASASVTLTANGGAVSYKPTVQLSASSVKIGDELTLSGSGYPAKTQLKIMAGVQNPGYDYGLVSTDAQGNFTKKLKLDKAPNGETFLAGPLNFVVMTQDSKLWAGQTLTLTAN